MIQKKLSQIINERPKQDILTLSYHELIQNGLTHNQAQDFLFIRDSVQAVYKTTEERPRITCPQSAADLLMAEWSHLSQEHLLVILLDTRNRVIKVENVYKGSLNSSVVRVAELFRPAIVMNAAAVIIAHNHPSGDPSPSPEDVHVTRQIVEVGKKLDIDVLDHVIVACGKWVSLKERSLGFD